MAGTLIILRSSKRHKSRKMLQRHMLERGEVAWVAGVVGEAEVTLALMEVEGPLATSLR